MSQSKEEEDFHTWLKSTKDAFIKLPSAYKTQTIKELLEECDSEQLCYLSQVYLPNVCQVDFLKLLPREVSLKVLKNLDGDTLQLCSLVSTTWFDLINSSAEIWLHMIWKDGGVRRKGPFSAKEAQLQWRKQSVLRGKMYEEGLMEQVNFRPGGDVNYSVKCMYYKHQCIATCSEDRTVYLWDTVKDRHIKAIEAHSVCQVKCDDVYVYTSSYDNTAASWVIDTGRLHCRYIGHFNGVLTVDADREKKLVITGSADSTIKLWHLDRGWLLQTFSAFHSGWIKQVEFLCLDNVVSLTECSDNHLIAVLSSDAKGKIVVWTVCVSVEIEDILVHNFQKAYELTNCLNQPIVTDHYQICISGRLTKSKVPKLSFFDYKRDTEMKSVKVSLAKEVTLPVFLPNNGKLLGAGKRFAVFHVTEDVGLCTNSYICVLDLEFEDIFSTVKVPHESRYSEPPCLGDKQWLDGFTDHKDLLFVAVVQPHNFAVTLYYLTRTSKLNVLQNP